jgi:signal transduction histidine kinase
MKVPSIRGRLAHALLWWSVLWSIGVALAVGLAAQHELDELLDETLQSTAAVLVAVLGPALGGGGQQAPAVLPAQGEGEFAWQVVGADGAVLRRSANAPAEALLRPGTAGFSRNAAWRVHASAIGDGARMLVVAHTLAERREAQWEVILSAVLAALSIGLLGHLWLRTRVREELLPLDDLSRRVASYDPLDARQALGTVARAELAPVHDALEQLGRRLAQRVAHERIVAAHAAHALRTPLAGMDAQLAVALREAAPALQPRLQRVRDASVRLQRVVRSLLDLFRIGAEVQRQDVRLKPLVAHLPVPGLAVTVDDEQASVQADPDLLAAALANLLDNAQRHGARSVRIGVPAPGRLRVADDGRGAEPDRVAALRDALATQRYETQTGLGLMLADLVARAHRGRVELPDAAAGFVVELVLAA